MDNKYDHELKRLIKATVQIELLESKMNDIKLIAGRSNEKLARSIADSLDTELVKCTIKDFPNGEIIVDIDQSVRGKTVYFIQTGASDKDHSLNDYYVEAIQVADACRRSGTASISIIYAAFPYARSDKKDKPRISIMSAVIANGLKDAGYSRIICMDIHASQTQGVTTIPFDNLYAIDLHIHNLLITVFRGLTIKEINDEFVLIAPDNGGSKRIRAYAEKLKMSHAIMDKQRNYAQSGTVPNCVLTGGDVKGKTAIIIDDIADTMGTMVGALRDLTRHGVNDVIIIVTHGVLSKPALDRINDNSKILSVIVTNTIDQTANCMTCPKLRVVDTSELFADTIRALAVNGSISALFT